LKENVYQLNIDDFEVGKSQTKLVEFPSFYGLQKVQAPVYVYRAGQKISPCVVVTACIHGDETNGIRIAQSLMLKKLKLSQGTLIILPVVNIYGFMNKLRYLPDRKDLNRCFPGHPKGSFGSRFADFIFQNITRYGDVFIDLHSGGPGRFNVPQIRCDLKTQGIKELIEAISIPLVVNSSLRDGSLRQAISDLNKPCIVFEGGEGLRVDETITKYGVNLVQSIMAKLEMIPAKSKYIKDKVIIKKTKWVRAHEAGILINKAHRGKVVKKEEVVGELRDINGKLITRIKMEHDGVILGISQSAMIMAGDALYNLGFLKESPKDEDEEFFDYFDFET
jgi:predicted deacylase